MKSGGKGLTCDAGSGAQSRKGQSMLVHGRSELVINLSSEAGRNAYLAVFHAARAFIFERTGKIVRRHESVQREFTRLASDEANIDKGPSLSFASLQSESCCRLRDRAGFHRPSPTGRRFD